VCFKEQAGRHTLQAAFFSLFRLVQLKSFLFLTTSGRVTRMPVLHLGLLGLLSRIRDGARVGREGRRTPAHFLDFLPVSSGGAEL
jgi:hypothetical protein